MSTSPISHADGGDGIRVLHVDDQPSFADVVKRYLERDDDRFDVTTATSPSEGLTLLDGSAFDCIVSDYDMPTQNGIEFLETVRDRTAELPFILYTGKGSEEIASDAISAGVTDYLQKSSGSSQYTVLANRIANAVDQYRAKREVHESQKRLSLFFEQSPLGVIEWDDAFNVARMNDAAERILGYSSGELRGESWRTIVAESDQDRVADVVSGLLVDESGYHISNENVRKNGDRIVCEWHNRVVSDANGEVVAVYSQFQDVTERRERERELERYEAYLQESTDLVAVLDETGEIKYESPSITRILGYDPEDLVGQNAFDLVHPDDIDESYAEFTELVSDPGGVRTIECRLRTADDDWRWLEVRGTNRLDQTPINGIVTNNRDITDRKAREAEFKQKEHRYQAVFNDPNILVGLLDTDGTVLDINQTAMRYTDASLEDVIDATFWETPWFDSSAALQAEVQERVSRAARGAYVEFDTDLVGPDGDPYTVEGIYRPVRNDAGEVVSLLISGRDVTERATRERDLERLTEKYETIFDHSRYAMFLLDVDDGETFRIAEINEREAELLGRAASDVTGKTLYDLYDEAIADRAVEAYRRCLDRGEPITDVAEYDLDGETRTFETILQPVWTDGTITQIVGVSREITELQRRQRELEETNALLSTLFETLPVGIIAGDDARTVLAVNERFVELFEIPNALDDVVGADCDRITEDASTMVADPTRFIQRINQVVSAKAPVPTEEIGLRDGRTFAQSYEPIDLPDGEGHLWVYRDITEQQRREERLQETTARLEALYEHSPDMIDVLDPDGTLIDVNHRFCAELGYEEDDLLGRPIWDLDHLVDEETVRMLLADFDLGERRKFDGLYERRDGSTVPVEVHLLRLDVAGDDRFLAISRDITKRKQYERRITALHETAQALFQAETAEEVGTLIVDAARDILGMRINAVAVHDDSETVLRVLAQSDRSADLLQPEPVFRPGESLAWEAFETGEVKYYGDVSSVTGRANPDTAIQSEILLPLGAHGVLLIGSTDPDVFDEVDISLAKTLATHGETALDRLAREWDLERQNARLEEFASVVSHDLRNPLTVAVGRVELAQDECESEHLDSVEAALTRSQALIDDLLTLAREGTRVSDIETVDLGTLAEDCWRNVATGDATIRIESDRRIEADPSRLQQLLENLYRNAIQHGGDDVDVTVGDLPDGFYLEDDGRGIPADMRDDVFEIGFSTAADGTGFGLGIVKEIADAHGWRIRATDGSNGGARFELSGVEFADA